jgi:hypothetical protein
MVDLVAALDRIAEALERRGHGDLAARVDAAANELLEQTDEMLQETGFDEVMRRTDEVADKVYRDRIEPVDTTHLYSERP